MPGATSSCCSLGYVARFLLPLHRRFSDNRDRRGGMRLSEVLTGTLLVAGGVEAFRRVRAHERQARRRELAIGAEGSPRHRVVIVGAGFAGLAAANTLHSLAGDDPRFDVLMIDRHNYHLFYPLLYQVSTGGIEPGTLAFPARVVAREHGFRFLEADVRTVDLDAKRLDTDAGPIAFDD